MGRIRRGKQRLEIYNRIAGINVAEQLVSGSFVARHFDNRLAISPFSLKFKDFECQTSVTYVILITLISMLL